MKYIRYPLEHVDAQGRSWHPYDVIFDSPDGQFSVDLYAISEDHARLQLEALKENGHLEGQILDTVPGDS